MPENQTIMTELAETFPNALSDTEVLSPDRAVAKIIDATQVKEIMKFLQDKGFDHLSNISGVDYPPDRMEVVYHVTSYSDSFVIAFKTSLPRDNPVIDTICDIYWNANWYEREIYELFGIDFPGHPYLRVLLLPEEMGGEYPLRKDYAGYPNPT